MSVILQTILLSLAPISELRGGIPFALFNGVHPVLAYVVAVLANILVVPLLFFFLTFLHQYFLFIPLYKRVFNRFLERTRRKLHAKVERYGYFGLTLFVAIPLPVTGAWTGTIGAWFFGMDKVKSFFAILLGVLIAGIIVTAIYFTGGGLLRAIVLKNG